MGLLTYQNNIETWQIIQLNTEPISVYQTWRERPVRLEISYYMEPDPLH